MVRLRIEQCWWLEILTSGPGKRGPSELHRREVGHGLLLGALEPRDGAGMAPRHDAQVRGRRDCGAGVLIGLVDNLS